MQKRFSPTQEHILALLSDGLCHSGNALGRALGVSRSAIWKQINQLVEWGVPIASLPQQGYQLHPPLILLDEDSMQKALTAQGFSKEFALQVFSSIDSTNRYVKELPYSGLVDICCAEHQTQGRGRFNRQWHSPFGENIYCSSRWNLQCDLSRLSGLSLITSLAVLATIQSFGIDNSVGVKWPNDLIWANKKLSGNLIEIQAESHANAQIIIGIGLNINSDTQNSLLGDRPWCSLYDITGKRYNRNDIIVSLLLHLDRYLEKFTEQGLKAFQDEWRACDYLAGKAITVTQGAQIHYGKACGIDEAGLLVLEEESGKQLHLSSGDTRWG